MSTVSHTHENASAPISRAGGVQQEDSSRHRSKEEDTHYNTFEALQHINVEAVETEPADIEDAGL